MLERTEAKVVVNVAYSYDIIRSTAHNVAQQFNWSENKRVQALCFSNNWVNRFLKRAGMRRRKITREDKDIPIVDEVKRIMKIGQEIYSEFEHTPSTTWNMDETAVTWSIGPTHLYCPRDQQRASQIGISNTKLRITAVITVNAAGAFAPLMIIIKHSVSSAIKPDQTGMKVIRELHSNASKGFSAQDGWELLKWEKEITIKGVSAMHKNWYLIHTATGHVITSQYKAWNDQVRMLMWVELVIGPIKRRDGKMLLWFDNCGCHKVDVVEKQMSDMGIHVALLPPNMTAILQVLDLVVNGPLKAHIRHLRAMVIVESFKVFKAKYCEEQTKPPEQRLEIKFKPRKPDMYESMADLIKLFETQFKDVKFVNGVVSSFLKTGTVPITSTNEFLEYKEEINCGTIGTVPSGTMQLYKKKLTEEEENDRILDAFEAFLNPENNMNDLVDDDDEEDDYDYDD